MDRLALAFVWLVALAPVTALAQPVVPVTAATVVQQDVPVLARGIGVVQALQSVILRARIDGTLDQVFFTEGQEVKQGDLLAQIDPRPYQAALDQAIAKRLADTAMLGNARADLSRYSEVARSGFASRQQVDTQSTAVVQQEAVLKGDDAAIAMAQAEPELHPADGAVRRPGRAAAAGSGQPDPRCRHHQPRDRDPHPGAPDRRPVHAAAGRAAQDRGCDAGRQAAGEPPTPRTTRPG